MLTIFCRILYLIFSVTRLQCCWVPCCTCSRTWTSAVSFTLQADIATRSTSNRCPAAIGGHQSAVAHLQRVRRLLCLPKSLWAVEPTAAALEVCLQLRDARRLQRRRASRTPSLCGLRVISHEQAWTLHAVGLVRYLLSAYWLRCWRCCQ